MGGKGQETRRQCDDSSWGGAKVGLAAGELDGAGVAGGEKGVCGAGDKTGGGDGTHLLARQQGEQACQALRGPPTVPVHLAAAARAAGASADCKSLHGKYLIRMKIEPR